MGFGAGKRFREPVGGGHLPVAGFVAQHVSMQALELVGLIGIAVALVGAWLWLDRLANRWFQALPDQVKERGLVGLFIDRLWKRGPDR